MRPPGRPRNAELDAAILAAAERQLGQRGYGGISLDSVAAEAGISTPSVRRRFRNKLELVSAVIDSMRVEPLPAATGSARPDARAILENFQSNLLRPNGMAILGTLLAEEERNPQLLSHFRQRLVEPRRARLRAALSRGVDAGHLSAAFDVDAAVNLLVGSFYARYLAGTGIPERWAETVLGILWPPEAS